MQEVWKVSTTAGARRAKKGSSVHEASTSSGHPTKESDASSKLANSAIQPSVQVDSAQVRIV